MAVDGVVCDLGGQGLSRGRELGSAHGVWSYVASILVCLVVNITRFHASKYHRIVLVSYVVVRGYSQRPCLMRIGMVNMVIPDGIFSFLFRVACASVTMQISSSSDILLFTSSTIASDYWELEMQGTW